MKTDYKAIAIIVIAAGLVFANSLNNRFVYDDEFIIQENHAIRNWGNISGLFSDKYYNLSMERSYWPVVTLSYFINYSLGKLNPFVYHLTNLLFHILNSLLIYLLVKLLVKDDKVPLISALLFAVHPVHTESVTYICGRTDVMAASFFLLAFYLFITQRNSARYGLLALVSYALGLFCKEMIITLPFIIVLYDYCFYNGKEKGASRLKALLKAPNTKIYAGYAAVTLLYLIGRYTVYYRPADYATYPGGSIYTTFLTMSTVFTHYLRLLVYPVNLCLDYIPVIPASLFEFRVIASLIIIAVVLILAVRSLGYSKIICFSIFFYLTALLPVSNIIPIGVTMAERYLYLPSIGFCILVAVLLKKYFKKYLVPLVVCLLAFYSVLTVIRNNDWQDSRSLWTKTSKQVPANAKAHNYLGMTNYREGKIDEAIVSYKKSLEHSPENSYTHSNLGVAYIKKDMLDDAIKHFREAVRIKPDHMSAVNNLAGAYYMNKMYDKAIEAYKSAIALNPFYIDAYANLGVSYATKGMYEEARETYNKALAINPNSANIRKKLQSLPVQ